MRDFLPSHRNASVKKKKEYIKTAAQTQKKQIKTKTKVGNHVQIEKEKGRKKTKHFKWRKIRERKQIYRQFVHT